MEASTPIQPTAAPKPWWSVRRICVVFVLLFALILTAAWWLTPIEPYATLNFGDECGLYLFSPDGTMLVTSAKKNGFPQSGPLRVWDVDRGHERFSLAHGWKAIGTVLFSPDGGLLVALERTGDLKLWNTRNGEEAGRIRTEPRSWTDFRFSFDGRFLVFRDSKAWPDKHITFWNIESEQEQGSVESDFDSLAFAPDGESFATFRQKDSPKINEVLLWRMEQTPVLVKQHRINASHVAISPDLKIFATADDLPDGKGQVAIWDMMTGEKRWSVTFNEHGTKLLWLSFLATGKILSVDGTAFLRGRPMTPWRTTLWDVTSTPKEIGSLSMPVVCSSDGEWVAVSLDAGAKLNRVSVPESGADLIVNGDWRVSRSTSFSPDGKMILVTGLYRSENKPFLGKWLPEKHNPFPANPGGAVVRVWDTDSRREIASFQNCREASFSPNGQVLATLRDDPKAIDLWKVPFRASLWHILGWTMIVWLIVVVVGWAGLKIQRKMFSRTNAPIPRPQSGDGKEQPPDSKEPPPS